MLNLPQLIAAGITPTVARVLLPHLIVAFDRFEIDTPRRMAAFIGQYGHETSGFTRLEENLYYTDPARIAQMFSALREVEKARAFTRQPKALANRVYANRNGNGSEASGDGWNYRGRGLPHLTGRGNYRAAGSGLGLPFGVAMVEGLKAAALTILVYLIALPFVFIAGAGFLVFFLATAWLLGREYFELAAMRFRSPAEAKAMRRANAARIFTAGLVIAAFVSIPIVNLATPLFGMAFMVHLHKRLSGSRPEWLAPSTPRVPSA